MTEFVNLMPKPHIAPRTVGRARGLAHDLAIDIAYLAVAWARAACPSERSLLEHSVHRLALEWDELVVEGYGEDERNQGLKRAVEASLAALAREHGFV